MLRLRAGDGEYEMSNSRSVSRRSFIGGAALLAGAAATPGLIMSRTARAQQKVPPASVKYQDKPNGNQQCNNCLQFVPGGTPTAVGTCKVVEGPVSPSGYCIIWVAKP
jgi:High potential iron-sulfur protein